MWSAASLTRSAAGCSQVIMLQTRRPGTTRASTPSSEKGVLAATGPPHVHLPTGDWQAHLPRVLPIDSHDRGLRLSTSARAIRRASAPFDGRRKIVEVCDTDQVGVVQGVAELVLQRQYQLQGTERVPTNDIVRALPRQR